MAVIVSLFFAFIALPLGAVSVDLARIYVELQRLQATADAAATAGVTYMPENFAAAKARALDIVEDNGFQKSRTVVTAGSKPTQLKVTVSSTVDNAFAGSFGMPTSNVSRWALADFNGPAPMGSPCNVFGNEPAGSSFSGPTTSALKTPALANCNSPQFWGSISGPEVWKDQGSQFETRRCGGVGEDGCASAAKGALNTEYDPRGYVYIVRVTAAGVGQPVRLQLFDPAYAATYALCQTPTTTPTAMPSGTDSLSSSSFNSYATDPSARYAGFPGGFCVGDDPSAGKRFGVSTTSTAEANVPTITSFGLRKPIDTLNPYAAPPEPGCVKQFPGYSETAVTRANLKKASSGTKSVNDPLARVFRQWVDLCTFTPTQAGDYYLQVRTNVKMGGTIDATTGISSGNNLVYTAGDDSTVLGTGVNNFGIRAISSAAAGAVSVASNERMRIFANADSATTTFNLVKVIPAAQNKTLVVTFFDVGEGASNGSVRLIPPADATGLGTSMSQCTGEGVTKGTLASCQITGINISSYNGKLQTIRVPIASTYSCTTSSQGGCWWRVEVKFGSGNVNDATTWTARIAGEPVRLIE